jgi:hypothetical protein
MSDDGADLTLLLETTDPIELASVRSLLDGHGLKYVVQGELHSAMVGGLFGNPAIAPRVLVAQRDLEQATELLKAQPDTETDAQGAAELAGNVCPVHLKDALTTCGRCGTFLCADCKALGQPALCEDCSVSEQWQRKPKDAKAQTLKKTVVWVMLAPVLIAIAGSLFGAIVIMLRGH